MGKIELSKISTKAPGSIDKKEAEERLQKIAKEIGEYQERLAAEGKQSLLVIMQGMDSSGKDSATQKAFQYASPVGLSSYSFKKPTDEEFAHDFLWRVHKQTPGKGEIKIFLRSHYEDVLIQRVHGWIDEKRVQKRIEAINAFEELLQFDANTTILKFYLHLSKEEQENQLMERVLESDKHWKHNDGDWEERELWNDYQDAYENVLNHSKIEWNIIPVDDRWYKNYKIAETILDTLKKMNPQYPPLETERTWKK